MKTQLNVEEKKRTNHWNLYQLDAKIDSPNIDFDTRRIPK